MVTVGAVIVFAADAEKTRAFYDAIGIDLQPEQHEDEAIQFAADLDGCHFAVFPAAHAGSAPSACAAGETMPGFLVPAVDKAVETIRALGAPVLQEPDDYPWGRRALVEGPDGRRVELFTPPSN
jgi:predicted enzyme related to lactoylglutathione lyase